MLRPARDGGLPVGLPVGLPRAAVRLTAVLTAAVALGALGALGAVPAAPNVHVPTVVPATHVPLQCCKPDVMLHEKACADGSTVSLECSFIFILDKDKDKADHWVVGVDGTLTMTSDNATIHKYCLARMAVGEGSVHDVALVCLEGAVDGELPDPRPAWWFRLASFLTWVSVVCLALTLAAHLALPDLRDLQGRCHMGAVASLGLGLNVLAVLQVAELDGALCTTMAFLAYYWFMSAFFWLNVTSFNVWRSVVLEHKRFSERTLFACYAVTSWGAPLLILMVLLTAHLLPEGPDDVHHIVRPQFGVNKCWFYDDRATWAWFYGPLAVLLSMNVVYFVWTTAHLWRQYGNRSGRALRCRLVISLKLFLIMGISWIFELISSAADSPGSIVWYFTDTFNAMQGVVILLVLVVCRRRTWRAMYKRRPCGLRPPENWAFPPNAVHDECASTDSEDDDEHELKDMASGRKGGSKP